MCWLLLRDFGQPMACPLPWGEKRREDWQDTFIMGQKGVWMHYDNVIIMFALHRLYDGGMRRQQRHLLLWRIEREQGKNFSHTWNDAAGIGGGTSIVQGATPPSWEGLYIYNSILGRVFDTIYVKELSYEMTVALLQRLAALSFRRLDCLLKCSQVHFTSNASWRHVDDHHERLMEGSTPCYIFTSLAWVHKHKEKDLHAAIVDFPSMHFYAYHPSMESSLGREFN